ncbi:hypothetical protein [Propionibacterium australiense]|nr:hypothetical protein [Propionibacterium australiense]
MPELLLVHGLVLCLGGVRTGIDLVLAGCLLLACFRISSCSAPTVWFPQRGAVLRYPSPMARNEKREQHIAVFGESGSGKTVLLSSFYGASQERSVQAKSLFHLVASDPGQGNRLYKNYLGMMDRAELPSANRFASTTYSFSIRLKPDGDSENTGSSSGDALGLVWHDYPGEWFEQDVSGPEEAERRLETFRSLLDSDVALILVDAQKLLDNAGEEERYLKSLFHNLRNSLLVLKDDLLPDGGKQLRFPRIWVIALSKADLMPGINVDGFRDLIIGHAADELDDLRGVLGGMIVFDQALSIGEDFLLLSSAKFEPDRIDLADRIGVELVLPIAAILPLERHVRWHQRMKLPRKVANTLLDSVEVVAKGIMGVAMQMKKESGMGKKILGLVGAELVAEAAKVAGERLKRLNTASMEKGNAMGSVLTGFKMDLERGEKDQVLLRSQR